MKTTDSLAREHKYILRALNVLEHMSERAQTNPGLDQLDVEELVRFLKLFADERHQGKEESILFPAVLRACHYTHMDELRQMTFEHDQERSLVEGMEDTLLTKKGEDFVAYAERLTHILRNHIYKEEHILFPMVDAVLTPAEDERLAAELAAFDPTEEDEKLKTLLRRLTVLEWKYLRKAARAPDFVGNAHFCGRVH